MKAASWSKGSKVRALKYVRKGSERTVTGNRVGWGGVGVCVQICWTKSDWELNRND